MSFPNRKLLIELIDRYLNGKEWSSFKGMMKTGLKRFASIATWSNYQGPEDKKKICTELKEDILAIPNGEKDEVQKWAQLCIEIGVIATFTLEVDGKGSQLAQYLHAIRTYILAKITSDLDSRNLLNAFIEGLKKTLLEPIGEAKTELKTPQSFSDLGLLTLTYLGDVKAFTAAQEKKLLNMYPTPNYLMANYFKLEFFNEQIKTTSTFNNFEEFETDRLQKITPPAELMIIPTDTLASAVVSQSVVTPLVPEASVVLPSEPATSPKNLLTPIPEISRLVTPTDSMVPLPSSELVDAVSIGHLAPAGALQSLTPLLPEAPVYLPKPATSPKRLLMLIPEISTLITPTDSVITSPSSTEKIIALPKEVDASLKKNMEAVPIVFKTVETKLPETGIDKKEEHPSFFPPASQKKPNASPIVFKPHSYNLRPRPR